MIPAVVARQVSPALAALALIVLIACGGTEAPAPSTREPEAAATSSAAPTESPAPTAAATPGVEPAATLDEQPDIGSLAASAFSRLQALMDNVPPRTSTTPGELAAAEYLNTQLHELGYETSIQEFPVPLIPPEGQYVTVEGAPIGTITARVIQGSGDGVVSGRLVHVGLGREDELPSEGLDGAVALIERGILSFNQKVRNVTAAGAVGAIIFNNDQGLFSGTFGEQLATPTVGISRADGQELVRALQDGPVSAELALFANIASSQNVVAIRAGSPGESGGSGNIIVVGAHYDTVPQVAGANDNASGTAVALEIASQLAGVELTYELRIVLFGAEELGLLGSRHYVSTLSADEVSRTTLMLNLDALGAGQLEVIGDRPLVNAAMDIGDSEGIRIRRGVVPPGTSSDHASFQAVGIPVVFLVGSNGSAIHSPLDTIDRLRPQMLGEAAVIGLRGLLGEFLDIGSGAPSVFSPTLR